MNQNCFICYSIESNRKKFVNIFGKDIVLQSKKKIWELLGHILEKTVSENTCHSRVLCVNCFSSLSEYDSLLVRLQVYETRFLTEFKNTLSKYNLKYENYGQLVNIKPKLPGNNIILPASKLQPIPPNYFIDLSKLSAAAKSNMTFANTDMSTPVYKIMAAPSKPVTSLSSGTMPKIKVTSMVSMTSAANTLGMATLTTTSGTTTTKNPVLSCSISSLPRDFLSVDSGMMIKNEPSPELDVETENDEHSMEIDEECSLPVNGSTKLVYENEDTKNKQMDTKSNFFDVGLLLSSDGTQSDGEKTPKYLLDKYTLLNDDEDDEEETIVMENGDKTTIIRVAAGQRLMYDGKEISLVEGNDDDLEDHGDDQDSNDESQIELQVSGDEETANAIIAAAQEQGAFIKVESGEMFRVESVRSKTEDEDIDSSESLHLQNIVGREGDFFKCLMCSSNPFRGNADSMMSHLKVVHTARIYICSICHHLMGKRSEYHQHLEQHNQHTEIPISKMKLHVCTVCKKKFNSKVLLSEHMNMHTGTRPYSCNVCHKTFASKYTHQAHLKTHMVRARPFKCKQCEKTFFTQQNLTQHEKTHLGIKEFICKICDKAFASQHNLEVHGVIHSGRKPFKCTMCSKGFARRAEVKDHMRIHTGERPFKCDICGATFTQRSNLHSHKRATHMDDKRYECTQCQKRFKRRRLLDYHVKAAHTGERPLVCEVCRATFVYPEHYKKHIRIHSGEKPFDCEVCGKSFNSRDNRNTHRFVHSDKKPYECLTCGAGYMRKQLLYQHMNTTGHVAESIVINQPRVIKTTVNILEDADDLELEDNDDTAEDADEDATKLFIREGQKIILQDKSSINLAQDSDDVTPFLMLHNLGGFDNASDAKLDDQGQIISTDDKNVSPKLLQVRLPGGQTGWVAINHDINS